MKLYIMRHGPAEDGSPSGDDADRALTRDGADRVRRVVETLIGHNEAPREIVSSPLVRARETAEIVASLVFKGAPPLLTYRDELGLQGSRLTSLVTELLQQGKHRVMLVGHEPTLSHFVETRLAIPLAGGMQKAMVVSARVRVDEASAAWDVRPRFILEPKSLAWKAL